MSFERRFGFWAAALVLTILVLYVLGNVLLPFVAGMALAYLLDPLADRLQRAGFSRLWATVVILFTAVLVLVIALVVVIPFVANQAQAFLAKLPENVGRLQALLAARGGSILQRIGGPEALNEMQSSLGGLMTQAASWFGRFLQSLWSGGQMLVSVLSLLVVTPVVAFYLLVDWDNMIATIDSWLPRNHRDTIRRLAREIDGAISGFLRGQTLVCVILGTMYAVGLTLIGLNFGALIGMTAGIISFIPYVGTITGFLLAMSVAIVQFWPEWQWVLATAAIFGAGQFIEGNILSPKLVGDAVGLHPVWLMFALLAFGTLFGFVGLLLAVPLAAALGVLGRFGIRRYMASPLYSGGGARRGQDYDVSP